MGWTKSQFITAALEEIGLASYQFDISPDMQQSALYRMDAMMADWNARGIRVGYPLASRAASSVTDETDVPDAAIEAVISNLALRLAPSYGKQVTREVKVSAKNGYNTLVMRSGVTDPIEKQFPSTLPRGAGSKPHRYGTDNYFPEPSDPLEAGPDSELEFN